MSDIRQRKSNEGSADKNCQNLTPNIEPFSQNECAARDKTPISQISVLHWILVVIYLATNFHFCYWLDGTLPKPLSDLKAGSEMFSEKRARRFLETMSSYGQKPSGPSCVPNIRVRAYDLAYDYPPPQRSQSHTQLVFPPPQKVACHTQSILTLPPNRLKSYAVCPTPY